MASEFIALDVEANSTLNSQQLNEFFKEMKKTVWKIRFQWKPLRHGAKKGNECFYTGVCIRSNGLILTSYFNLENLLKIDVQGPNEEQYSKVELVHRDSALGLALVRAKHLESYNYAAFAPEINFRAGQHVYASVYPRKASSSILLLGHLAYQCDLGSEFISQFCPIYRTVKDLPAQGVCPIGLGSDVSLLQIAGLGASNEFQGRKNHRFLNQFGFPEGRGGPVFDAIGHLIGLVAFQQAGFDFAIQVAVLKSFVSKAPSSS